MSKSIFVKTNNQAEKIAALYFISQKENIPVYDEVLRQTLNNKNVEEYPLVGIEHGFGTLYGRVTGFSFTRHVNDCVIVPFSDLKNYDSYKIPTSVEVKLNSDFKAIVKKNTITVGCQEFPASILKDLVAAHEKVSK